MSTIIPRPRRPIGAETYIARKVSMLLIERDITCHRLNRAMKNNPASSTTILVAKHLASVDSILDNLYRAIPK